MIQRLIYNEPVLLPGRFEDLELAHVRFQSRIDAFIVPATWGQASWGYWNVLQKNEWSPRMPKAKLTEIKIGIGLKPVTMEIRDIWQRA